MIINIFYQLRKRSYLVAFLAASLSANEQDFTYVENKEEIILTSYEQDIISKAFITFRDEKFITDEHATAHNIKR